MKSNADLYREVLDRAFAAHDRRMADLLDQYQAGLDREDLLKLADESQQRMRKELERALFVGLGGQK